MERKNALSPRQMEIMRLASEGMTDKQIAQATGLSLGTLRSHWDRMRARLGASSRGEVIARTAAEVQRALAAEVEILRRALNHQQTFVWTADGDGFVDYVNDWFADFSGLPRESFLGPGFRALVPDDQLLEVRDRWSEAQRRAKAYRTQVEFRAADGTLIPHVVELSPISVVDGRVERWMGIGRESGRERTKPTPA